MIVTGQRDLKFRVSLLDYLDSLLHGFQRTFVHRDSSLFEPTFFTQVAGEIFQETAPVVCISCIARFGFDELDAVGGLVVIVETQCPRDHGVAADQVVDANIVHHEIYPFVENSVVIFPTAVEFLHAEHHAVEMIFGLSRPGFVHDAGGDGTLSGVGQHLHDRAHGIEMFFAPERHVVVTGHGIRVLPQVQMEFPVFRFRQGTVQYVYLHL